jgi:hypothetical protein
MKVALLNSYYPPDAAVTGKSLEELALHLQATDPSLAIRVYSTALTYVDAQRAPSRSGIEVVRIGPKLRKRGKVGRLVQSVSLGRWMAREACGWADVIVSLTDPPLLGVWIGRQRARTLRPIRWIEWTMDLFPEAFAAAKIVTKRNPLYRAFLASQRRYPADAYICLGDAQCNAVVRGRRVMRPTIVVPCGIVEPAPLASNVPEWREREQRIVIAYAGNIGEGHCPEFLPAIVEHADPDRFVFVFALYGHHASALRRRLGDRSNVLWRDNLSHSELMYADVHAACLHPDWTHVCVPSKAVTTVCLGRPLLFAGDGDSDTVRSLGRAAWTLEVPRDGKYDAAVVRGVLDDIASEERRRIKASAARTLGDELRADKAQALAEVTNWILARDGG